MLPTPWWNTSKDPTHWKEIPTWNRTDTLTMISEDTGWVTEMDLMERGPNVSVYPVPITSRRPERWLENFQSTTIGAGTRNKSPLPHRVQTRNRHFRRTWGQVGTKVSTADWNFMLECWTWTDRLRYRALLTLFTQLQPTKGNLETLYQIFKYIKHHKQSKFVFWSYPTGWPTICKTWLCWLESGAWRCTGK